MQPRVHTVFNALSGVFKIKKEEEKNNRDEHNGRSQWRGVNQPKLLLNSSSHPRRLSLRLTYPTINPDIQIIMLLPGRALCVSILYTPLIIQSFFSHPTHIFRPRLFRTSSRDKKHFSVCLCFSQKET